jgi:IS5 family transposase
LESFAPNHARGPAFILEHGDPSGLILRIVFGLALRQTEGLIGSIIHLQGIELAVPDHSTLGRRAQTVTLPKWTRRHAGPLQLIVDSTGLKLNAPGEWLVEKHGTTKRSSWHKLHIGLDAVSGEIVASTLTGRDIDDGSQVAALLDQVDGPVGVFLGDGAYDSADVYAAVEERHPDALVIAPPRAGAVASSHQRIQSTRFGRGSDRPLQACHRQRPSISYRGG